MTLVREERKSTKYTLRNADSKPKVVVIEHPSQESEGWKLSPNTPKPEETTASFHRFRVAVDAGKTSELAVDEFHSLSATTELSDLNDGQVKVFVDQHRLTTAMKKAFDDVGAQKSKVTVMDWQIKQHNDEIAKINTDQTRLRENMKALKGSVEEKALLQRYVHELNLQEDRLAALRKGNESLQVQRNQAKADLDKLIESIDLNENF
jgi:chromosome segregation ATPase